MPNESKAETSFERLREKKENVDQEVRKKKQQQLEIRTLYKFYEENIADFFFFLDDLLWETYGEEFGVEDVEIDENSIERIRIHFNFTLEDISEGRFEFQKKIIEPFLEEFGSNEWVNEWIKVHKNTDRMRKGEMVINFQYDGPKEHYEYGSYDKSL